MILAGSPGNWGSEQDPAYSPLWGRVRSQTPGEEAQATPLALQAGNYGGGGPTAAPANLDKPNPRHPTNRTARHLVIAPPGAGSLFDRILDYRTLPKIQLQLPIFG
jgi:hypothetical protein